MTINQDTKATYSTNLTRNKYLSARELADYLGVARNSIANWERQGLIPVIRLGRRRIYRLDRVETALERLERKL